MRVFRSNTPNGLFLMLALMGTVLGCAAEGGRPGPGLKQEALEGAPCAMDSECDRGEFCDLIMCIPERECASGGVCRAQTRFSDIQKHDIPDNSATGVTGEIFVDRGPSSLSSLSVSVQARHTYRGDLRVALRSPMGTEFVLANQEGGSADDLNLSLDVSAFDGEDPAGMWLLQVSDLAAQDVGTLEGWQMELGFAEPGPAPEPETGVWTRVDARIESQHPYANDTRLSMTTTRFTGSGTRARIHFTRLDTEQNYDFVEILDMDTGALLDTFTGHLGELTTQDYGSANLEVRLSSDYSVTDWGYNIDYIEVFGAGCLQDSDCGEGYDCPLTRVCVRAPCFQVCMPEEPATPGAEGDACASYADCGEGLYCDASDVCAPVGTCGVAEDCSTIGNGWIHPTCVGYATCGAGQCGWVCAPGPLLCNPGDTRWQDCNTCTCTEDGRWACTEMACAPETEAGLGQACHERLACAPGLVCDRGRYEGAVCGRWDGICVEPGTSEGCAVGGPAVCGCNGQSFANECARQGSSSDWASDGRCELSTAIPDADVDGTTASVFVAGPSNSREVRVQVQIDHTYVGDLEVWFVAPNGDRHTLTNRAGGSADNFHYDGTFPVRNPLGSYTLHIADHASLDVGVLRFFNVTGVDPAPTLGQACFVANGVQCDHGQYCATPAGISCGFGSGGTCQLRPTVCAPDDSPVCSCGSTRTNYINACMAAADGYSVRFESVCP